MATAFDTFQQYADIAFEGQINDLSMADVETYVSEGVTPFGRAIFQGEAVKSGVLATAEAGMFIGISVMKPVSVASSFPGNGNDAGANRDGFESSNLSFGRIWVRSADGANRGQQAYAVPETGEITNEEGGNHLLPNARFMTDATAGGLVLVQVQGKGLTTLGA